MAEISQSIVSQVTGSDSALSQSLFSQTFSGSGLSALTYTFQKTLQTIRLNVTATYPHKVVFMMTPPGGAGGYAIAEKVVFWTEHGANLPATMSIGYREEGFPYNITNGNWTGSIQAGDMFGYSTASLHPDIGNRIVPVGEICFVTSSGGPFALQIFYRTQE